MELRDYLRVLRARWRIITACTLVGIAAAAAVVLLQKPTYQSTVQLFVSARDQTADIGSAYQGGLFTQQRVQSYAEIVSSPRVTRAVAHKLHLHLTSKELAGKISASAPQNTVLLNVDVTDRSPHRAQAIAAATGKQFVDLVNRIETPAGTKNSPVKVSVVKPATLPTSPVSPRTAVDLALGFIVGLVVGLGAGFLRDHLDTSVKSPEQVAEDTGLPTLGLVGFDPDARRHPLFVQSDPHGVRAEAFRQLRTNLQFVDIDAKPTSLVITSSVPEEGKSTTTCNLAIALAQAGLRVALVEGDLRRPRLADYLGLENAVGTTNVLIGAVPLDDALQRWGGQGQQVLVLPSGPIPPNPSELLGSQAMAKLIADLESRVDLVLIDASPLLPVTDAAVLATASSGAIIVAYAGKTSRDQLRAAAESLVAVDARILGVVLNFVPTKGPDAYRRYGYHYRYEASGSTARMTLGRPPAVPPDAAGEPEREPDLADTDLRAGISLGNGRARRNGRYRPTASEQWEGLGEAEPPAAEPAPQPSRRRR